MKDVKRFHKRIETRLKSKKVFTIISTKKLKLKSVIHAMLDYPGSICIKDIEKQMVLCIFLRKCLLLIMVNYLYSWIKNVECDYNAIDLSPCNV